MGDPEVAHPREEPSFSIPKVATTVEVRTKDPISPTRTSQITAPSFSQWQIMQKRMEALEHSEAELRSIRENMEQRGRSNAKNSGLSENEVISRLATLEQRKKDLEVKKNSPPGTADSASG